jgi:septin 7
MASALGGLRKQSLASRSEGNMESLAPAAKDSESMTIGYPYPGNFYRRYRSILDIEDHPSLSSISIPQEESMEGWVVGKLNQNAEKHTTSSSGWTDILCFYTATNGATTVPNGHETGSSPVQEIPQSVSSTDPKIAAQQASDMRNIVRRKLTSYVGFANLPNQWHRKSVRKGFNFNVMVVGMPIARTML